MTITIFGATGMVGKYLVRKALAKNYKVIAFGRNIEQLIDADNSDENLVAVKGYVFDEGAVFDALKDSDAVLSALGGGIDGTDKTRSLGIKNIVTQMQKASVNKIVALGGTGVLDAKNGGLLMDAADYDQKYLPVSKEHLEAFNYLKASHLNWTFVCPPYIKDVDGKDEYVTASNVHPADGTYEIAAGTLANFMLKEIESPSFLHQRVGIANLK